ncbi:hypothetical protein Tco_0207248, partial [Tanacetum coccineum]
VVHKALPIALKAHFASQESTEPTPTPKPTALSGTQSKPTARSAPAKSKDPRFVKGLDGLKAYWLKRDLLKSLAQDEKDKLAKAQAKASKKRRKDDDDPYAPKDQDPKRQRKDKDSSSSKKSQPSAPPASKPPPHSKSTTKSFPPTNEPKSQKASSGSPKKNQDVL